MTRVELEALGNPAELGHCVRMLRHQARMKQSELAQISGVSQSAVSQVEQGSRCPTLKTIFKILDALGFSLKVVVKEKQS